MIPIGGGSAASAKQKKAEERRERARRARRKRSVAKLPVVRGRARANESAYERGKKRARKAAGARKRGRARLPVIRGRARANEEAYERGKRRAKKQARARANPQRAVAKRARKELARRESPVWTPRNEAEVKRIIQDALTRHHGRVLDAYKAVDGKRHRRKHFYDQNLAIASDYLRARKDVGGIGVPEPIYRLGISRYMEQKKAGKARPLGNGPVSPYSKLALKYMYKGASDGTRDSLKRPGPHGAT